MNPRKSGFTLIELMMSIGTVGVLSGLLFPSLCKAKAKMRATTCVNNLHQIGVALALYVGDFHEYPSWQLWDVLAQPDYADPRILPYLARNRSVLYCPDKRFSAKDPLSRFSYGYNGLGSGRGESLRLGLGFWRKDRLLEAQVKVPADMIAIGETGVGTESEMLLNPNADLHASDESPWPTAPWLPSDRHRGRANMLFCDGHVESAPQARWIEKTDRARSRWNNDHLPHPETW